MMRHLFLLLIGFTPYWSLAQPHFFEAFSFDQADTLRGSLRPERTAYDVHYYDLQIQVDPAAQSVAGYVDMHFTVLQSLDRLQFDLFQNLQIDQVSLVGADTPLVIERLANAVFVDFPTTLPIGTNQVLRIAYNGQPIPAKQPPWDGGFVWQKDRKGRPWVGVACEGDGASLWWPNKDHLTDEPDSARISVAVPPGLMCVANGDLERESEDSNGWTRYDWRVSYPINNYNISVNIGHYDHFDSTYVAQDGEQLRMDYYVLDYNLERAKQHFRQSNQVLAAFEHFFGKYPFWEDGFALVETPYLGMEHQSAIAYGNRYMRGYLGGMIPSDMDWDYIIVHETGHEYFGNSVSAGDIAEMWIHESFTTYMETLFVEYVYGYDDALRYIAGQRAYIENRYPIVGPLGVNFEDWGTSDHYFKGAWMLHTLRHALADTSQWRPILRGFYDQQAYQITKTEDFTSYLNQATQRDWSTVLRQYLYYPDLPTLIYKIQETPAGQLLAYRWEASVAGFDLPIRLGEQLLFPSTDQWQTLPFRAGQLKQLAALPTYYLIQLEQRD